MPPSVAPAELLPPLAPVRPPTHSSPAPGGAQPPPLDPEEFEELELALAEECFVLCTIARWPPGRSPVSTVSEHILIKADMENGDKQESHKCSDLMKLRYFKMLISARNFFVHYN